MLDGATNVRFTEDYDGAVKYALRVSFPADEIIDAINKRLSEQGWTPGNFSAVEPQLPTSHLDGWGKYIDGDDLVRVWSGDRDRHVRGASQGTEKGVRHTAVGLNAPCRLHGRPEGLHYLTRAYWWATVPTLRSDV